MDVQTFNFTTDQLFFAGKIGVLMKGTSEDDSPIPGYLYKEISDISHQSPAHCQFLLDFLVKRLSKTSCHVKYKTLKLMNHVAENGAPTFRVGLRRMSTGIQEATKFGGPPDPLHGNLPYQLVRKTAKELCQLLFDVDEEAETQTNQTQTQVSTQRMVGIGPVHSTTSGKYQGFGNTPVTKKSLKNTLRDGLEKLAEQLGDTSAQRQAALLAKLDNSAGDYVPPVVSPAIPANEPESSAERKEPVKVKKVPRRVPGRAGGGWDEDDDLNTAEPQGSTIRSEGSSELSDRLEMASVWDWSAEEELVTEYLALDDRSQFFLLKPSHMKEFKRKCLLLNCEKVVELIHGRLQSSDDYVVVRAMLLLETLLMPMDTVSLDYVASVCQEQLVGLVHSNADQRIRDKALKIIRGLECYSSYTNIFPSTIGHS